MSVLDASLAAFRDVLGGGWVSVGDVATLANRDPAEFRADWAQASWETLVEAALSPDGRLVLEIYGDGADCNGASSRVWKPDAVATHAIHCHPRTGPTAVDLLTGAAVTFPQDGFLVDRFACHSEDGWYREMPPFDGVLVSASGREALFRIDDLRFALHVLGSVA
jgi:hypothetical protein